MNDPKEIMARHLFEFDERENVSLGMPSALKWEELEPECRAEYHSDALAILSALEAEGWKLVRMEPSAEVRAALNAAHAWGKEG